MLKKRFDALSPKPDAGVGKDARVDALYAEASAAWARDDLTTAEARIKEAIDLDNNLPVLTYFQGMLYLKRSQF